MIVYQLLENRFCEKKYFKYGRICRCIEKYQSLPENSHTKLHSDRDDPK